MDCGKYRIAVVGCGRIARNHVAAYQRLEELFEIVAFVDQEPSRAEGFAREYGVAKAYASLEGACAEQDLDAADLCLPPSEHCPVAVQAAEMGLHVTVEKPLAVTCAEVDRMVAAGERNDVVVMSGQSRRFNGPLRKAKEIIESGQIGTPQHAFIASGSKLDQLATPWWADPKVSGPSNLLYNWGPHFLDWIYYLYGPPARVYAEGGDLGGPTAGLDSFSAVFGYETPFLANVTWSYIGRVPAANGCVGTEGTVEMAGPSGVLLNGEPVPNEDQDVNQFHTMLREFHSAIAGNREPETSALRCRVTIEMIEAILKSCETHEVVPIEGLGATRY